jgi:hypothetical protein
MMILQHWSWHSRLLSGLHRHSFRFFVILYGTVSLTKGGPTCNRLTWAQPESWRWGRSQYRDWTSWGNVLLMKDPLLIMVQL